jgi:choline dehydrogenase-like flavoprotein
MGSDDQAVLDSELRVRGVKGLRVIDASQQRNRCAGVFGRPSQWRCYLLAL